IVSHANAPELNGIPLPLETHGAEVAAGFEQMYRFILAHRETILAAGSPLHRLGVQQVRFIFRPTETYRAILKSMLDPKYLRDGADQDIQCKFLYRAFGSRAGDSSQAKPLFWPIVASEETA